MEWKPIPGLHGYEASADGRIRSVGRMVRAGNGMRLVRERELSQHKVKNDPYFRVTLWDADKNMPCARRVHALVALAWHGPRPDGMCVSHVDGNAANNAASNLVYETQKANIGRQVGHGTRRCVK